MNHPCGCLTRGTCWHWSLLVSEATNSDSHLVPIDKLRRPWCGIKNYQYTMTKERWQRRGKQGGTEPSAKSGVGTLSGFALLMMDLGGRQSYKSASGPVEGYDTLLDTAGRRTDERSTDQTTSSLVRFHFCITDGLLLTPRRHHVRIDTPYTCGRIPQVGQGSLSETSGFSHDGVLPASQE